MGGLPSGCGVDEFRSYFSQYGDVVEAQVMIDHNTGNSRGFGFVTFGSEDTVNTVVGPGKSNTDHEIMGKCVEVKRAEPKGASSDRRTNREHYNPRGGGNDVSSGATNGSGGGASGGSGGAGGGTNAAAAAAAAYYSNYPQSLAEQYNAYYNNPQQWQQYFAAMGYNFNAFQQPGYNPYQQYLQAYMNSQGNANGASGASAVPNPPGDAPQNAGPGSGSGGKSMRLSFHVNSCHSFSLKLSLSNTLTFLHFFSLSLALSLSLDNLFVYKIIAYDNQAGSGRYSSGGGNAGEGIGPQNGHGSNNGGGGPNARRPSRRDDRYHPYR